MNNGLHWNYTVGTTLHDAFSDCGQLLIPLSAAGESCEVDGRSGCRFQQCRNGQAESKGKLQEKREERSEKRTKL